MILEKDVPAIEARVKMSDEEYLNWNISETVKRLINTPAEYPIALTFYELHKHILRNKGVSERLLLEGDEIIEKIKREYIKYN